MDDAAKPNDPPASVSAAIPAEGTTKRTYAKPILTDHGTVADLTRGGAGTTRDARPTKRLIRP